MVLTPSINEQWVSKLVDYGGDEWVCGYEAHEWVGGYEAHERVGWWGRL